MAGLSQTYSETAPCPQCGGTGWKPVSAAGEVRRCDCRQMADARRLWDEAQVPPRYQHCTLENFALPPGAPAHLEAARLTAAAFAREYPLDVDCPGLLFTGAVGVGKTHLAVAIVRRLVEERGVVCRFCDHRDLLKRIQATFDPQNPISESQVIAPLLQAEVLLLDDLGVGRATEWTLETLHYVLNDRYNQQRTTIVTTNLSDVAETRVKPTLAEAVGERVRSRLYEMCKMVRMEGEDFRKSHAR